MRILIVRLGSIGDVVHTLPALAAIRRALPESEISWAVEPPASQILKDNPLLDRLIELDTKGLRRWPASGETLLAARQQLRRLRASTFDLALDFQGLLKSATIARLSGAKQVFGFTSEGLREPPSRFLLTDTVRAAKRSNVIVKNLELARRALRIDLSSDPSTFEFPIHTSQENEFEAEAVSTWAGGQLAILNPGGGWPTKLWSAERFGALADQIWRRHKLKSIVTYGPGEEDLARRVLTSSRSAETDAVQAKALSLKSLYATAKRASIFVGGDTGPMHLAVAASTPVVGLFGPTEWWRNGSPNPDDICVERNKIDCREDCHRRSCSKWICMDIEVETVMAAVTERLRRAEKLKPDRVVQRGTVG